jgi:hypothetical protein
VELDLLGTLIAVPRIVEEDRRGNALRRTRTHEHPEVGWRVVRFGVSYRYSRGQVLLSSTAWKSPFFLSCRADNNLLEAFSFHTAISSLLFVPKFLFNMEFLAPLRELSDQSL